MRTRLLGIFCLCLVVAACHKGGGSENTSYPPPASGTTATSSPTGASGTTAPSPTGATGTAATPAALTNFATITVDGGPAQLHAGPNGYTADNTPYVSVTLCAPGSTTNCQTIDHVLVDTGSVGLRIFASVINASLLSALSSETDAYSNAIGSCYGFVDGYMFGSVRQANFQIGGETVA